MTYLRNISFLLFLFFKGLIPIFAGNITNDFKWQSTGLKHDFINDSIIAICESYVDISNKFCYGCKYAAFRKAVKPINQKYEINCSTFSMLTSTGIRFEGTKYGGGGNNCLFGGEYGIELVRWFSDGGLDDRNIKYSRDIARKLYYDGYSFSPNKEFDNIKTGDIVFFNLDPTNDRPNIDFMGVDHSAIFAYKFGDRFLIYEVGDDKGPKKVLMTKESMGKAVLVGRLPRKVSFSEAKSICNNNKKKKLNCAGNGRNNYKLSELQLKKPLLKGHCYTLFIEAYVAQGLWLNATYNGTSSYAFNMTVVRDYRPDNDLYQIHFTAPDDIYSLRLNVRSNDIRPVIAEYRCCELYEGIVEQGNKTEK